LPYNTRILKKMKMKEHYIIEYLNCKKNFQKNSVQFQGTDAYEQAIEWGKKNWKTSI
jgi:hypothetical protein